MTTAEADQSPTPVLPSSASAASSASNSVSSTRRPSIGDVPVAGLVSGMRPALSHDHLKPGHKASILDYSTTIDLYRDNAAKSTDPATQIDFARFLLDIAAQREVSDPQESQKLVAEAVKLCQKAASASHPEAQFMLAEMYARGLTSAKRKPKPAKAFPLYMQASKHGHPDASYRAAVCLEKGEGTSKNPGRALLFFQKAAANGNSDAMYRLGIAGSTLISFCMETPSANVSPIELHGELTLPVNPRNGIKWLKHACAAHPPSADALHDLALMHESGVEHVVFVDLPYAVKLLQDAAELGHVLSMYRLGGYYEHGMVIPAALPQQQQQQQQLNGRTAVERDPRKSFEYYMAAAERGHGDSMFGVSSWFLTGHTEADVPQSDVEAFRWMQRAADTGLHKAYFALAYFYEQGITANGQPDMAEALRWYERALNEAKDKRAAAKVAKLKRTLTAGNLVAGSPINAPANGKPTKAVSKQLARALDDAELTAPSPSSTKSFPMRKSQSEQVIRGSSSTPASPASVRSAKLPAASSSKAAPVASEAGIKPRKLTEAELKARREEIRRARTGEDACVLM
ncbi:Chitin synthase 4 [Sorochytrium milnesiophthora]